MIPVSVVIITKNEAGVIAQSVNAARLVTDDIVIIDNGSTDDTLTIARSLGCRVYQRNWNGYGANKNTGVEYARNNWILSIDADEVIDQQLVDALQNLDYNNDRAVYDIDFRTYFGHKLVRFGSWGRDHHIRLFNRKRVRWSELAVHETLLLPCNAERKKLRGHIHHYSVDGLDEYKNKAQLYASLSARKYLNTGRHSNLLRLYISPVFSFLRNYIFYLGFLDGIEGWYIATITAQHTWLKYYLLGQMEAAGKSYAYVEHTPMYHLYSTE